MELLVTRKWAKPKYTIGRLYINGEYFCDTLEDITRNIGADGSGKVRGQTAIPAGRYRVVMTYSPRFKRVLPLLSNVPHFEGVRIHAGNTAKDTEGCILVGKNDKIGWLSQSRRYEDELTDILLAAQAAGDMTYITIQ